MEKGVGMALGEKVANETRYIELWHDVLTITCSMGFTLGYKIKGRVASLRAMPTPFFLCGLAYAPLG